MANAKSYIKGQYESAESFVKRLPPSKILRPGDADSIAVNSNRNLDGLDNFIRKSTAVLKIYEEKYINEKNEEQRASLVQKINSIIALITLDENFLEGRFTLFLSKDEVDEVWLKIVRMTMAGQLGINAKVGRKVSDYVIRVYMKNYKDHEDISRVHKTLKDLMLLDERFEYKCTALSRLGIRPGHIFCRSPTLYQGRVPGCVKMQDGERIMLYDVKKSNESPESFVARILPKRVLDSNKIYISVYLEESTRKELLSSWSVNIVGRMLLETYEPEIEVTPVPKRYSIIQELEKKLTQLAVECNFVQGRWIANATDEINYLWQKAVRGTIDGTLGINATIKKNCDNQYEISVITKDFNDEADVTRVLSEMKKIGFNPPLFYKTQLYSNLGIIKNNVFGLNPIRREVLMWES